MVIDLSLPNRCFLLFSLILPLSIGSTEAQTGRLGDFLTSRTNKPSNSSNQSKLEPLFGSGFRKSSATTKTASTSSPTSTPLLKVMAGRSTDGRVFQRRGATARKQAEALKEEQVETTTNTPSEVQIISRGERRSLFSKRRDNKAPPVSPPPTHLPPQRFLHIEEAQLAALNSHNSWVEVDLSDQRACIYSGDTLIIKTQISTGTPGFETPTGVYTILEKLVSKKSSRYGTWYDALGQELEGDDAYAPPPNGVEFVGVDMPYWMRVNGAIGMHVGYVTSGPASHGCIRVPSSIQPLIYSKVKVGTTVVIKQ